MTKNQISSISEFLLHAGTDYRVFDMGRTIRELPSQLFLNIENASVKPQFPRAQHTWFGIVFWDKTRSSQQYIWFVKLPIDEQGLVVTAARNHFLQIIVDALGSQLENAEKSNGQLPDNPYTFVPNQQQLADFNSISRRTLKLDYSQYYQAALDYLKAPLVIDWQTLSLQGIADLAANVAEPEINELVLKQFALLPQTVQFTLLISFENQPLNPAITQQIEKFIDSNSTDAVAWQHGLRALSQTQGDSTKRMLEMALAAQVCNDHNTLEVIAGRLWQPLSENNKLMNFMHKVAEADPTHSLFEAIFRDLVQLPDSRDAMLAMLRSTDKSPALTHAVGSLFSATNRDN
ncbi:DUF3549 family protein [Aliiglaciecola sp. LCG003]|uniref:DUF3549 family protein n=1 Tax=Aliiglaciecola sp. LCG003 TaxID=3053655 RepID=UPI002573539D|nr:DUF3549 family protein [Aliiglaciecola sp. LCG003]WJG08545.1 DUF3549 family protein [Aliiglaciecola sp. LCG003]